MESHQYHEKSSTVTKEGFSQILCTDVDLIPFGVLVLCRMCVYQVMKISFLPA